MKTDYGYHVIEILEKLDPEPATYEESRQEAEYDLRSTRSDRATASSLSWWQALN